MKQVRLFSCISAIILAIVITSCSPSVTLTSWKNPADKSQISKVVVMPLFAKLEYMKPFEQSMVAYFNTQGLKATGSLDILNPNIKYKIDDIKRKCDSIGADAILVFVYQGTDKSESYVPPSTYVSGGFGGYWGGGYWGGGYWGGEVVSTGGYWTTTSTVNLKASIYTKSSKDALWTGEIQVVDPKYVDNSATTIAQDIYADWQKNNLLKSPAGKN